MSDAIKQAIAELQNQIQSWEQDISDTKKMCNKLAHRAGLPLLYGDAELQPRASATNMRKDQFYGKSLTTAMREYLQMRAAGNAGPATVNEMFDALVQGGFDHGSANDDNAKRVMRITLTKNSSIFHRLPDDKHFGLTDWYPNIRVKKSKAEEGGEEDGGEEPKEKNTASSAVEVKPFAAASDKK